MTRKTIIKMMGAVACMVVLSMAVFGEEGVLTTVDLGPCKAEQVTNMPLQCGPLLILVDYTISNAGRRRDCRPGGTMNCCRCELWFCTYTVSFRDCHNVLRVYPVTETNIVYDCWATNNCGR